MKSEVLNAHFDGISQKLNQIPPHENMRQQAMNEAMKYGIPHDIATKVVDARLAVVTSLFEKMRQESENAGGKLIALRTAVDTELLAQKVQMNYPPENHQIRLDAIQTKYRDDISLIIQETAEA